MEMCFFCKVVPKARTLAWSTLFFSFLLVIITCHAQKPWPRSLMDINESVAENSQKRYYIESPSSKDNFVLSLFKKRKRKEILGLSNPEILRGRRVPPLYYGAAGYHGRFKVSV